MVRGRVRAGVWAWGRGRVGTDPRPVTPPQLLSRIEACVCSQIEPQGLEQPAASRVLVQMWSAPPVRFQYG